ncbi:MAG: sugar phosphate isomerase/epimerase family protein [Candidatus Humimicrobiaceae bacterium]
MKLGLVSSILYDYSFEQLVDFVSDIGIKSLEVACWPLGKAERRYAGITHINVNEVDFSKAQYYNDYLKKKKVEIAALFYSPNPLVEDLNQRKVYIEHIKKVISATKLMGIRHMNTFIGKNHTIPISENIEEFKKVWPDIINFAEDNDVIVSFENCPMYFTIDEWPGGKNLASFPKIWRELFSIIDSKNFGINYDPSHLVWQMMDYIKPIYEFRDKITNVHIKDAKIYKDKYDDVGIFATPLEYHAPKLPGLGDINWGKFVSALTDIGFKGSASIEIEDRAFEGTLNDRLNSIKISQNFMSQFIN